jgi:hypothetical protein
VWFGTAPEAYVCADDLAALASRLGSVHIVGAGRTPYLTAIRHPEVAASLVNWSISAGPYASQNLGYLYHAAYIKCCAEWRNGLSVAMKKSPLVAGCWSPVLAS